MMKKIMAVLMTAVFMLCSMSVSAFAAETFTAVIGFADGNWAAQDWESSCAVTGDGTYTINANCVAANKLQAGSGVTVMTVNFEGLSKKLGNNIRKINVSDVKVVTGSGVSLAIDQSKVLFGDLETNGNFRIEIYNSYGRTKDPALSPINTSDFSFTSDEQFSITFTISGLDEVFSDEAEETEAAVTTTAAETTTEATTTTAETTTTTTTTTTEATTTTTEATTTTTTTAETTTEETTAVPEETEESAEETEETTTAETTTTTTTTTAAETTAETTIAETTTTAAVTTAAVQQAVASDSDTFASRNSSLIIFAAAAGIIIIAVIVAFVIIASRKKKD